MSQNCENTAGKRLRDTAELKRSLAILGKDEHHFNATLTSLTHMGEIEKVNFSKNVNKQLSYSLDVFKNVNKPLSIFENVKKPHGGIFDEKLSHAQKIARIFFSPDFNQTWLSFKYTY